MYEEKKHEQIVVTEHAEHMCQNKIWIDWAMEDPLYKAVFTRLGETHAYTVQLLEQTPVHSDVARNMVFEVAYPLYQGLNDIVKKEQGLSTIKIQVSSRQHVHVRYTSYCTPETWSFTVVNDIVAGLTEQLSMKQTLNRGLLLQLSFIKTLSSP